MQLIVMLMVLLLWLTIHLHRVILQVILIFGVLDLFISGKLHTFVPEIWFKFILVPEISESLILFLKFQKDISQYFQPF